MEPQAFPGVVGGSWQVPSELLNPQDTPSACPLTKIHQLPLLFVDSENISFKYF
jgi:hypothetical protein